MNFWKGMTVVIAIVSSLWVISASSALANPIVTESTSNSTVKTDSDTSTTVKSPPPSAISPSISGSNSEIIQDIV